LAETGHPLAVDVGDVDGAADEVRARLRAGQIAFLDPALVAKRPMLRVCAWRL
jgi:hypothetical protein